MIIESSLKLRLGARVKILQLVMENDKILKEESVYGHVLRPATFKEYQEESKDWNRADLHSQYYYYEVRLEKPLSDPGLEE
jgi:hypothetical protein